MSFRTWLRGLFLEGDSKVINLTEYRNDSEEKFYINAYAVFTVIDFIATLMSRVEWQTIMRGKLIKGLEWHRLNVKPNKNQNAVQFWKEVWSKLLYYQEVLIVEVGGQLIVADSFNHHPEYAIAEDYFEHVSKGNLTFDRAWNRSEVIYLEYSNTNAMQLVNQMLDMYSDMISTTVEVHKKGGGERGILEVGSAASGPSDFEEKFGGYMNSRFKKYFQARNAVMPIFRNMKYSGHESGYNAGTAKDVEALTESALSAACTAYKVPAVLLKGQVQGTTDALNLMLTVCIDPLAEMMAAELSGGYFTAEEFTKGSRIHAWTNNIKHTEIFDCATQFDKLFACGFSYNDLNGLLGLPQIDEEWANAHHITKNYSDTEEGGEKSEE